MKTYSLKTVADRLGKWVKPTHALLIRQGIKPAMEFKSGKRTFRVYDVRQIDDFVHTYKEGQRKRKEAKIEQPAITPTTTAATTPAMSQNLLAAISKLTAAVEKNTELLERSISVTLEVLTHPSDDQPGQH